LDVVNIETRCVLCYKKARLFRAYLGTQPVRVCKECNDIKKPYSY